MTKHLTIVEVIPKRDPENRWWRVSYQCPKSGAQRKIATYDRNKVLDAIVHFRGPVLFYVWDKRRAGL